MGEIFSVLNCQGFARCATGVACKSLNDKKKYQKNMLLYTFIYLS